MIEDVLKMKKRDQAKFFRKAAGLIEKQSTLPKMTYSQSVGDEVCLCAASALALAAGESLQAKPEAESVVYKYYSDNERPTFAPRCEATKTNLVLHLPSVAEQFLSAQPGKNTSFEHWNDCDYVTKQTVASGFRTIARAIEHGGVF